MLSGQVQVWVYVLFKNTKSMSKSKSTVLKSKSSTKKMNLQAFLSYTSIISPAVID